MQFKLSFLGAAQNVTGSRYLLEADGARILIDCGLYQERQLLDRNWDPFPVPPAEIDAILLTHAHLDHCGFIPRLVRDGFAGRIFCTPATAEIVEIVLLDAGNIQEEDAAFKIKRHKRAGYTPPRPVEPLYTAEDAAACSPLFSPQPFEEPVEVAPGLTASFHGAGHILGAAMIKLRLDINGQSRTVVFSGDVGRWDRPILRDPSCFDQADYVITESTYGDRLHPSVADIKDELAEVINSTRQAGGNIIIPSFAIERAQDILYYLNELLLEDRVPPIMTFLDSPMAIRVTEVFRRHPEMFDRDMRRHESNQNSPFELPGLTMTRTTAESKTINTIDGTIIVIAGSGMCTGGRIKHHLVNNISRPESTILFPGYQARGTLGRRILDGESEVRILGEERQVKARIARIQGFSGHADRDELLRCIGSIKNTPRQVFVTHGETDVAQSFAQFLNEKRGWPTTVPEYLQTFTLD